ncbi:hypothetical protein N1851_013126 [Merluccius polli]|uniref:Transposable element P transposase-like GTP-binding insertion domain-containing protein n=1 Tax=Merluccius polli TaxID=89951 RepID=A0AA47MWD9_MERPO|nr:hypothetical protein N1851_013126 [Merluccius polli]
MGLSGSGLTACASCQFHLFNLLQNSHLHLPSLLLFQMNEAMKAWIQAITVPQDVVNTEHLLSSVVSVGPLQDLVSYQEGMALKLAPNLSRAILEPNHFEKMKVSSAMHIFSEWTSAALKYLVEEEQRPESNLTTSWFLEKMDHWFDLIVGLVLDEESASWSSREAEDSECAGSAAGRASTPQYIDPAETREDTLRVQQERADSPGPSCVSMKSDQSMDKPVTFNDGKQSTQKRWQTGLDFEKQQMVGCKRFQVIWVCGFPGERSAIENRLNLTEDRLESLLIQTLRSQSRIKNRSDGTN